MQKGNRHTQNTNPPPQNKKHPNTNATDRHNTNQQTNDDDDDDAKKKKKTGAGAMPRCTSWARSTGGRRRPRSGRREHKGKPKPQKGFGFPQRLKRKKESKRRRRAQPNNQRKRERTTNTSANKGQVLKGTNQNSLIISPEKSEQQQPETNRKPNNNHTKPKQFVRKNCVCVYGVAGPMGRPVVLRWRGGDQDTEGAKGSSRPGNRPTHASITRCSYK